MVTQYRNARLIDASGERYGDLCMEDGTILSCGPLNWRRADRTVDVGGAVLMPAFIDLHCHLLPGVDDGSRSMAQTVLVLQQFFDTGLIDEDELARAKASPLGIAETPGLPRNRFPAFLDLVRDHFPECRKLQPCPLARPR